MKIAFVLILSCLKSVTVLYRKLHRELKSARTHIQCQYLDYVRSMCCVSNNTKNTPLPAYPLTWCVICTNAVRHVHARSIFPRSTHKQHKNPTYLIFRYIQQNHTPHPLPKPRTPLQLHWQPMKPRFYAFDFAVYFANLLSLLDLLLPIGGLTTTRFSSARYVQQYPRGRRASSESAPGRESLPCSSTTNVSVKISLL